MRQPAIPLAIWFLAACQPGGEVLPNREAFTRLITDQFTRSAEAWNRGDQEAFLSDYAPDRETSFVSGGHLRRGFDFIRENYAPRFAPGAPRDSLRFEELDARPLSSTLALVTARFVLFRGSVTTGSGPFTLVMQRRSTGWKILHDHTSSDPR